ncbi:hypothetical protein GALMADRAFT_212861 [Galerina marginata CBS 339.88]|uniref:GPI ethanolamine phosphate transferase 2 C-terminal domain-containing protein n=1 Tax=Galerina marginata (strain CBS 339.88) TaxID=685588 RepID=A0A067SPH7_GALM3|nr:hypothetical protein GALMADRAFT_212861 [Galerina marginata CBS 339.88]
MFSSRLALLIWVFLVHVAGIYLFTRGFLLTRLSLSNASTCTETSCGIAPTHKRAVLLIIDALRFDFIAPNPPTTASPFHHNILTLPRELTEKYPAHSFLFNAYADPPTTTLQRIKGITTGSLPTFVDMGNNFGGSSIAEDSILKQLKMAGKKVAFMGDDTWMSVFPDTFEPSMKHPYDSFNVEDLHTVDEGVIKHLFPLLEDPSQPFDFLIGHFLGVDHVGHRVGPDHPSMQAKLQQMNDVLTRAVQLLEDDTLLVVLGDHGMDRSGDHGGDGNLETSSGMWIYSKGVALTQTSSTPPSGLLQFKTFPGSNTPHRSIQQIDILPTISLLLGVPIPYNNLGSVIPELFWRGGGGGRQSLARALQANVAQIMAYLDTYRTSPSGGELDEAWTRIQTAWRATQKPSTSIDAELVTLVNFNRVALAACRAMWAQFNPLLMSLGLSLLSMGLCASWAIYSGFADSKNEWDIWLKTKLGLALRAAAGGSLLGVAGHFCLTTLMPGVTVLDCAFFSAALSSSTALIISSPPRISFDTLKSIPFILIIHSIAFLSNSFTFWEDRLVPFLLVTSIVPYVITGFSAPNKRLRYRILGFSLLFTICVRLIAISTICREEQQPYCHVTFFASSSLPEPPVLVRYLAVAVAAALPYAMKRFLHITRADSGVAKTFLPLFLLPTLVAGAGYWILEWADSASVLGDSDERTAALRLGRTWIARSGFVWIAVVGGTLWFVVPLCLDIKVQTSPSETEGEKQKQIANGNRQVQVVGYANAFGSPYLVFWSIVLGLVYICTQLTGQVILALSTIALLSFLEVLDSVRDARNINAVLDSSTPSSILSGALSKSPPIRFGDITPIALLGLHAFYGTGHQSTISSLQWKSGFVLTPTLSYPWSVVGVVLNSAGPIFLFALAVPLTALWNRAPLPPPPTTTQSREQPQMTPESDADAQVKHEGTLAALGVTIYYLALLLGTAVSAAILRRHLMVWKVFAPRFIAAVIELLAVDVAVLLGVGFGVERITGRMKRMFGGKRPMVGGAVVASGG